MSVSFLLASVGLIVSMLLKELAGYSTGKLDLMLLLNFILIILWNKGYSIFYAIETYFLKDVNIAVTK